MTGLNPISYTSGLPQMESMCTPNAVNAQTGGSLQPNPSSMPIPFQKQKPNQHPASGVGMPSTESLPAQPPPPLAAQQRREVVLYEVQVDGLPPTLKTKDMMKATMDTAGLGKDFCGFTTKEDQASLWFSSKCAADKCAAHLKTSTWYKGDANVVPSQPCRPRTSSNFSNTSSDGPLTGSSFIKGSGDSFGPGAPVSPNMTTGNFQVANPAHISLQQTEAPAYVRPGKDFFAPSSFTSDVSTNVSDEDRRW